MYIYIYNTEMSSKEKGMIQELTDFIKASRRFIVNCEKPDGKRKTTHICICNVIYRI